MDKPDKARPLLDQFLSDAPDKHPARAAAEKMKADMGAAKPDTAGAKAPSSEKPAPSSKGKGPGAKPKRK